MQRLIAIGGCEVLIEVEQSFDPDQSAGLTNYVVRYSISRHDCQPIRDNLFSVHSYDLIDGTDYFHNVEAALGYGEEKAGNDIAILSQEKTRSRPDKSTYS
ncbi:hypothetical protein [Cupriavidus pauculus]|uniref:Uncharacterized protein n=1 Tax=Cupriavidus pauculus TaxID=82633 RepID=A0A2N5CDS8_9BURK|nr:hypothetical protein [Cupriavidus pauculus]PLQ00332.1 hypothetical protein CYJ10_11880 [Cupriavidus pauculus]